MEIQGQVGGRNLKKFELKKVLVVVMLQLR